MLLFSHTWQEARNDPFYKDTYWNFSCAPVLSPSWTEAGTKGIVYVQWLGTRKRGDRSKERVYKWLEIQVWMVGNGSVFLFCFFFRLCHQRKTRSACHYELFLTQVQAGSLSRITFSWAGPVVRLGRVLPWVSWSETPMSNQIRRIQSWERYHLSCQTRPPSTCARPCCYYLFYVRVTPLI